MKIRQLCLLLLGAAALGAAPPVLEPGPALAPGDADPAWAALFAHLAAPGSVYSKFTERRWFAVRKQPVVLAGEMRLSPEHGLSLHYPAPENRTLIVDTAGLLLRDGKGRDREPPKDPRATAVAAALLPVLKFDRAALEQSFTLHAARAGDAWRLDLVPRTPALARALGTIVLLGEGQDLRRLEFRRSDQQRVEIEIGESQTGAVFSAEDQRRFFR